MKKLALTITAAALVLAGAATSGCASSRSAEARAPESAGQFVDSSVITTRVKAALLEEPTLKSFQIGVETFKDQVQLSGFVDSSAAARRAGEVAGAVKGVGSVRNDLIVK